MDILYGVIVNGVVVGELVCVVLYSATYTDILNHFTVLMCSHWGTVLNWTLCSLMPAINHT